MDNMEVEGNSTTSSTTDGGGGGGGWNNNTYNNDLPKVHSLVPVMTSASSSSSSPRNGGSHPLDLAPGENWLQLVSMAKTNSIFDETQDSVADAKMDEDKDEVVKSGDNDSNNNSNSDMCPLILSLRDIMPDDNDDNNNNWELPSPLTTFLCLDVDGDHLIVKDMRYPTGNNDKEEGDDDPSAGGAVFGVGGGPTELEVYVARHGSSSVNIPSSWERLGRRQARILNVHDRFCIRQENEKHSHQNQQQFSGDGVYPRTVMVLEHKLETAILKEESQQQDDDVFMSQSQRSHNDNEDGEEEEELIGTTGTATVDTTATATSTKARREAFGGSNLPLDPPISPSAAAGMSSGGLMTQQQLQTQQQTQQPLLPKILQPATQQQQLLLMTQQEQEDNKGRSSSTAKGKYELVKPSVPSTKTTTTASEPVPPTNQQHQPEEPAAATTTSAQNDNDDSDDETVDPADEYNDEAEAKNNNNDDVDDETVDPDDNDSDNKERNDDDAKPVAAVEVQNKDNEDHKKPEEELCKAATTAVLASSSSSSAAAVDREDGESKENNNDNNNNNNNIEGVHVVATAAATTAGSCSKADEKPSEPDAGTAAAAKEGEKEDHQAATTAKTVPEDSHHQDSSGSDGVNNNNKKKVPSANDDGEVITTAAKKETGTETQGSSNSIGKDANIMVTMRNNNGNNDKDDKDDPHIDAESRAEQNDGDRNEEEQRSNAKGGGDENMDPPEPLDEHTAEKATEGKIDTHQPIEADVVDAANDNNDNDAPSVIANKNDWDRLQPAQEKQAAAAATLEDNDQTEDDISEPPPPPPATEETAKNKGGKLDFCTDDDDISEPVDPFAAAAAEHADDEKGDLSPERTVADDLVGSKLLKKRGMDVADSQDEVEEEAPVAGPSFSILHGGPSRKHRKRRSTKSGSKRRKSPVIEDIDFDLHKMVKEDQLKKKAANNNDAEDPKKEATTTINVTTRRRTAKEPRQDKNDRATKTNNIDGSEGGNDAAESSADMKEATVAGPTNANNTADAGAKRQGGDGQKKSRQADAASEETKTKKDGDEEESMPLPLANARNDQARKQKETEGANEKISDVKELTDEKVTGSGHDTGLGDSSNDPSATNDVKTNKNIEAELPDTMDEQPADPTPEADKSTVRKEEPNADTGTPEAPDRCEDEVPPAAEDEALHATPAAGARRKSSRKRPASANTKTPSSNARASSSAARTSTRKRARRTPLKNVSEKAAGSDDDESSQVRLLVTSVDLNTRQKNMVKKIGGVLLDDVREAHTATHVIASDGKQSIKRTPKLMIAIHKTPNIVTLDWLIDSAKEQEPLPVDGYLILDDAQAEEKYGFSMETTIGKIKSNIENETSLLDGKRIYVCDGVAGKKAPPKEELKLIIEAAGGEWTTNLRSIPEPADTLIVITGSEPKDMKQQTKKKAVQSALEKGALQKTTSWLFQSIMAQELVEG